MDVVAEFEAWADGLENIEPDVVQTMIQFKGDYLDDEDPHRWTPDNLEFLLLEVVARKIVADDEWFAAVVPTMEAYVAFLSEHHGLPRRASERLTAELRRVEPEFHRRLADPAHHGMAKSFFSSMPGEFPTTDAQLQTLMNDFNALPDDERDRILRGGVLGFNPDGPLTGTTLPPVRQHPVTELAEAARAATTMRRLVGLVEWIGRGKAVTSTGVLRVADARTVIGRLGLEVPDAEAPPEDDALFGVEPAPARDLRSARDHVGLHVLWTIAEILDWIDVEDGRVTAGAAGYHWRTGDDETQTRLWTEIFAVVAEDLIGLDDDVDEELVDATGGTFVSILGVLYGERSVDLPKEITTVLDETDVTDGPGLTDEAALSAVRSGVTFQFELLADLGAVVRTGDLIEVTPLGMLGINHFMRDAGAVAPMVDAGSLSAEDVLDLPELLLDPVMREEWVAAMGGPTSAARRLLSTVAEADNPAWRLMVVEMVSSEFGETSSAVLAEFTDHPLLGLYVRMYLHPGEANEANLTADEGMLLLIDSLAAVFAMMGDVERDADTPPDLWEMAAALVAVPRVETHPHGHLLEVLDAIGTAHPQGRVRKQAKKAAHKTRLARAGR